jgi:hypothetical protein
MCLYIGHTTILVNYQTTWSQLVTPIIPSKTNVLPTLTYAMWYNVIPPFVRLDPNLYPTYSTRTNELDLTMFRNYACYVPRYVYLIPKQPLYDQHTHHILLEISFL